jgi:purine-binding chemotaxis protein CheW
VGDVTKTQDIKNKIPLRAQSGKYLTFRLGTEEYGLEILKVQEIIGLMPITKVPKLPEFIRGILNLRGKLIPVIELRSRFEMPKLPDNDRTCIIVVQIKIGDSSLTLGIVVDSVSEVLNINENQLESPPVLGDGIDVEFILGMAKYNNRVILLLDIDRVLTKFEIVAIDKVAS